MTCIEVSLENWYADIDRGLRGYWLVIQSVPNPAQQLGLT